MPTPTKTGVLHSKRQLTLGNDPAYVSTPYASFGAAQAAIQGILAALIERERSRPASGAPACSEQIPDLTVVPK